MSKLVVYYSRTGRTRKVAKKIADELDCEIVSIRDRTDRSGVLGYLKSGFHTIRKVDTDIESVGTDPGDHDLVIIGTPVWVGTMATPVRSYLGKYGKELPEVAFFSTQGDVKPQKAFKDMSALIGKTPKATLILKDRDVDMGRYGRELSDFLRALR